MSERDGASGAAVATTRHVDLTLPDLGGLSLRDLAGTANDEHQQVLAAAEMAVVHAIRCGGALVLARSMVPAGGWGRWVDANLEIRQSTVQQYMRLATYREKLLMSRVPLTIEAAMAFLSSEPPTFSTGGHNKRDVPGDVLDEARRLRADGVSWAKLAEKFGLPRDVIRQRLDPDAQKQSSLRTRRYRARQRAARAALERQERDQAVKKAGGSAATAYSLIRRAAAELDKAMQEASDEETRTTLRAAMSHAHRAEDEIVRALKLERISDDRRRRRPDSTRPRGQSNDPPQRASERSKRRERLLTDARTDSDGAA